MEWSNEYTFKAEDKLNADSDLAGHVYRRLAQRLTENGTGEGGFVVQHHQGGDKVRSKLSLVRVYSVLPALSSIVLCGYSSSGQGHGGDWSSNVYRKLVNGHLEPAVLR